MRIGILEIVIIIIIIIAVLLIARISRARSREAARNGESTDDASHRAVGRPGKIRNNLNKMGIVLIGAGVLFALAGMSMFRWAVQGYGWALGAVLIGVALLFLPRRK